MASQVILILAAAGFAFSIPATAPETRSANSFPIARFSATSARAQLPSGRCKVVPSAADGRLEHAGKEAVFSGCGSLAQPGVAVADSGALDGGSALGMVGAIGATVSVIVNNPSKSPT